MKAYKLILPALIALCACSLEPELPTTYQKIIGDLGDYNIRKIYPLQDGTALLLGSGTQVIQRERNLDGAIITEDLVQRGPAVFMIDEGGNMVENSMKLFPFTEVYTEDSISHYSILNGGYFGDIAQLSNGNYIAVGEWLETDIESDILDLALTGNIQADTVLRLEGLPFLALMDDQFNVLKIRALNGEKWADHLTGYFYDQPQLLELEDGRVILMMDALRGNTLGQRFTNWDISLRELDTDGDWSTIHIQPYSNFNSNEPEDIIQLADGNIVVLSTRIQQNDLANEKRRQPGITVYSPNDLSTPIFDNSILMPNVPAGDVQGPLVHPNIRDLTLHEIIPRTGAGFIISMNRFPDSYIYEFNSDFSPITGLRIQHGEEIGTSAESFIWETEEGDIIHMNQTLTPEDPTGKFIIGRYRMSGVTWETVWERTLSGIPRDMILAPNGDIIILTNPVFNQTNYKGSIIRLNENGIF